MPPARLALKSANRVVLQGLVRRDRDRNRHATLLDPLHPTRSRLDFNTAFSTTNLQRHIRTQPGFFPNGLGHNQSPR
jgi:hypothetical protein